MFTFTDLIHAARCFVIDQIVKAAGHKYIKRIPISSNPTKYRYIYSATSTVGGKNILDEAHLKVGTKLMLQSEAGAQVHAHVEKVSGDKVTVVYDDGDKKGQSRTFTKQQLLNQFNEEHGISDQLTAAKDKLLADIQSAVAGGTISEKQLARLVERLESLDPAGKGAGQSQVSNDSRESAPPVEREQPTRRRKKKRDVRLTALAEKADKEITSDIEAVGRLLTQTDAAGVIQSVDRGETNAHDAASNAVKRALLNATDGLIPYYSLYGTEDNAMKNQTVQTILDVFQPNKTGEQAQLELKRAVAKKVAEALPRGIESLRGKLDYMKGAIKGKNQRIKERIKVLEAIIEDTETALEAYTKS